MSRRKFVDRRGESWEILEVSRSEWAFEPVQGNPGSRTTVTPPGYESDPFEMSNEELQRLLDGAGGPPRAPRKSPFLD